MWTYFWCYCTICFWCYMRFDTKPYSWLPIDLYFQIMRSSLETTNVKMSPILQKRSHSKSICNSCFAFKWSVAIAKRLIKVFLKKINNFDNNSWIVPPLRKKIVENLKQIWCLVLVSEWLMFYASISENRVVSQSHAWVCVVIVRIHIFMETNKQENKHLKQTHKTSKQTNDFWVVAL